MGNFYVLEDVVARLREVCVLPESGGPCCGGWIEVARHLGADPLDKEEAQEFILGLLGTGLLE
jgi:hypothetical protein